MRVSPKFAVVGMVIGGLLILGALFGLLGTAFGMYRAFQTLGSSGIGDPRSLSGGVSEALASTAMGMVLFPVGIVVLTVSIILYHKNRRPVPPPLPPARGFPGS